MSLKNITISATASNNSITVIQVLNIDTFIFRARILPSVAGCECLHSNHLDSTDAFYDVFNRVHHAFRLGYVKLEGSTRVGKHTTETLCRSQPVSAPQEKI